MQGMFIGGQWCGAKSGKSLPVHDPATGVEVGRIPMGDGSDATVAIDAAAAALDGWSATPPARRAEVLANAAVKLRAEVDRLAAIITSENGKPLAEARGEVEYSADYFQSAADEARRLDSVAVHSRRSDRRLLARPEPMGVVGAITPWNFPLAMLARKTAPALAVGCTQVVKPSELTPMSALALGGILCEVGVPEGVVNIVTGEAAAIGGALLADGRVRKLSFTGSTRVGRELMRGAADQVVRLSLELGGHAPFIVFAGSNVDDAVAGAMAGKFRVAGQTCVCPNRFIVHESMAAEFAGKLATAAGRLAVGRGSTPGVGVGPLISDAAVAKVRRQVRNAVSLGGRLLCGGETVKVDGCLDRFFAPTVVEGATASMECFNEETFGPVAPVASFKSDTEAIAMANATPYGLAGYAYCGNPAQGEWAAQAMNVGIVGINTGVISDAYAPFGGRGWSGFGREGGRWGLEEYISWKYICSAVKP